MALFESDVVCRWKEFVDDVRRVLLPEWGGRLVKSLGDGLLIDFPIARQAVAAAFALQSQSEASNHGVPGDRWLRLRIGVQLGEVFVDELDVYGSGVNMAHRLSTLGEAGDVVVSSEIRAQLVAGVDAEVEDLGDCYLRHLEQPVRAYRVRPPGTLQGLRLPMLESIVRPALAVLPFEAHADAQGHDVIGEALADGVRAMLCRSVHTRIVARMSCNALAQRALSLSEMGRLLNATYLLSGRVDGRGADKVSVYAELAHVASGEVVAAGRQVFRRDDVFSSPSESVTWAAGLAAQGIEQLELHRAAHLPLPNLDSYSLEIGSVSLMHRSPDARGFDRSRQLLEHLIERHRQAATPRAWLAKWHVLRVTRGLSTDPVADANRALEQTRRALAIDPHSSLCHAVQGFVHCHLQRDLESAAPALERAVSSNPNEPLAWLFRGVLHAFRGEGEAAVADTERAMVLSPLDPMRYYYESLAATAALSARRYERALDLAERSRQLNRRHSSTWRVIAISQVALGRLASAREAMSELRALEPELTVSRYLARQPAGRHDIGREWAEALREAGLPD